MTDGQRLDAIIVGAGFSGLYMLYRLRQQGLSVRVYDAAPEVGGTWYWNRYPGARCDVESVDYSYSFSPELEQEWRWSERYPAQPEILEYLKHVSERFDLRRDLVLGTRITAAHYNEDADRWTVIPDGSEPVSSQFLIMATGSLSVPKDPDVSGIENFAGDVYHTARWPEYTVDLSGQRVGVIGTGSSGVQTIPELANRAESVVVFQRTPAYSVPARNRPLDEETEREVKATYRQRRAKARRMPTGLDVEPNDQSALAVDEKEREREFSRRWDRGGFVFLGSYNDILLDQRANDTISDFVRDKIRETVRNQDTAESLLPREYPFGTKRPCYDIGYYETFNRDHVELVDLRKVEWHGVRREGVETSAQIYELDAIVLATGFDAMTGALDRIDIGGRDGKRLSEHWEAGPRTYLGVGISGFPNLFSLAGPGSPSVLTNMVTAIEQHVEWTDACVSYVRRNGYRSIEAQEQAEQDWVDHVNEVAAATLYMQANSWYMGANVPGKPRIFTPYAGGLNEYERRCDEVAEHGYAGFTLV